MAADCGRFGSLITGKERLLKDSVQVPFDREAAHGAVKGLRFADWTS